MNTKSIPGLNLRSHASVAALCHWVLILSLIVGYCFLSEYYPPNPHGGRTYDRDFFAFCFIVVLLVCLLKVERTKTSDILNRDQTEEWKGIMQYVFLAYHYTHGMELYNIIRVLVSAYVWLTGFGNFSFFYIKRDFSFLRFYRMQWRLNFLVLVLCAAMNNAYLLYYICPLHTMFFCMVYITMYIGKPYIRTMWGIRIVVSVLAVVIYLVWDFGNGAIFSSLFGFIKAYSGERGPEGSHNWHFRTNVDHYSTYLGMLFALNFPVMTAWFKKTEESDLKTHVLAKVTVAAGVLIAFYIWFTNILTLPKVEYNAAHAFTFWVPLLTYIFLRNCIPALRNWHMSIPAHLGKITLETYLLQHHVFMTTSAKSLLVLIDGYPKVNAIVVTIIFAFMSYWAFRVTMALRFMLIPDSVQESIRNFMYLAGFIAACTAGGYFVRAAAFKGVTIVAISCALAAGAYLAHQRTLATPKTLAEDASEEEMAKMLEMGETKPEPEADAAKEGEPSSSLATAPPRPSHVVEAVKPDLNKPAISKTQLLTTLLIVGVAIMYLPSLLRWLKGDEVAVYLPYIEKLKTAGGKPLPPVGNLPMQATWGLGVLAVAAAMIYLVDSYAGLSRLGHYLAVGKFMNVQQPYEEFLS